MSVEKGVTCLFCMKKCEGRKSSSDNASKPDQLKFICQVFQIDFDKIFKDEEAPSLFPFCDHCHRTITLEVLGIRTSFNGLQKRLKDIFPRILHTVAKSASESVKSATSSDDNVKSTEEVNSSDLSQGQRQVREEINQLDVKWRYLSGFEIVPVFEQEFIDIENNVKNSSGCWSVSSQPQPKESSIIITEEVEEPNVEVKLEPEDQIQDNLLLESMDEEDQVEKDLPDSETPDQDNSPAATDYLKMDMDVAAERSESPTVDEVSPIPEELQNAAPKENMEESVSKEADMNHSETTEPPISEARIVFKENLKEELGKVPETVKCRFCLFTSVYPSRLRLHEQQEHPNELEYLCTVCNERYSTAPILKMHLKTHSVEENCEFNCSIGNCKTSFLSGFDLQLHLLQVHISKQKLPRSMPGMKVTCEVCEEVMDSNKLLRHRTTHYKKKEKKENITCEICPNKSFDYKNGLLTHTIKFHERITAAEQKLFNCFQCEKRFATNLMLLRHISAHRLDSYKPIACNICDTRFLSDDQHGLMRHMKSCVIRHTIRPEFNIELEPASEEGRLKCPVETCSRTFATTKILNFLYHEKTSHPERLIHQCHLCDKKYSIEKFLQTHLKTHSNSQDEEEEEENLKCEVCHFKSPSRSDLATHLIKHTGRSIQCEKCPKKYLSRVDLKIHMMRAHSEERPHKCSICAKEYVQKYDLTKHMKRHQQLAGLIPMQTYICELCGSDFNLMSTMKRHIKRVHDGIKQPRVAKQCQVCDKWVIGYNKHMKIHLGTQKHSVCYFCGKQVFWIRDHLYQHTLERPHFCQFCKRGFINGRSLRKHLLKIHDQS